MRVDSKRSQFSDPGYDGIAADELVVKSEHQTAIDKAMKPLYGGLAGSRCDPVEEWPGDHDEAYGVPKAVREGIKPRGTYGEADRDDAKPYITDKPGDLSRKTANADLSGGSSKADDYRTDGRTDDSFTTHH